MLNTHRRRTDTADRGDTKCTCCYGASYPATGDSLPRSSLRYSTSS